MTQRRLSGLHPRSVHKLARIIFDAAWDVKGYRYKTRHSGSDWMSKDAKRAAERILTKYDLEPKQ